MALRALIIANGDFADARIPPLKSPVSDAQRLQAVLEREDVGPYAVELCLDRESSAVREAVERFFSTADFADRQLLFFSGHGFKHGPDGRLYFGTKDTKRETMKSSSLEARFVFEEASASVAQQTLIFIDSCYSGAFVKGHTLKAGDHVIARDDLEVAGAHGMAIITASSSVQTAAEIVVNDYTQSVFTRHLINGIETGEADPKQSGHITLDGLFRYVRTQMKRDAPDQEPKPHYFGLDGSVEVARSPVKPAPPMAEVVLPKRLLKKIASANFSTRRSACGELYLHADLNEEAAGLVRTELAQLTRDPHDFVKAEAKHQLERLDQRFPAALADDAAAERVDDAALAPPVPAPAPATPPDNPSPPPVTASARLPEPPAVSPPAPADSDAPPAPAAAPPRQPTNAHPGRSAAPPPKPASAKPRRYWPFGLLLIAAPVGTWLGQQWTGEDGSPPPVTVKLDPASGETAAPPAAAEAPQPRPGDWLVGQWVVNQATDGCTRRVHISRAPEANALVFDNPDLEGFDPVTDRYTMENFYTLVTSTYRYQVHSDGRITMQPVLGGDVQELSRCRR